MTWLPDAVYWVTAVLDGWTTERVLDRGGKEAMPVARKMLDWFGDPGLFVLKLAGYLTFLVIDAPPFFWYFISAAQFLAAVWNFRVLLRLKGRS